MQTIDCPVDKGYHLVMPTFDTIDLSERLKEVLIRAPRDNRSDGHTVVSASNPSFQAAIRSPLALLQRDAATTCRMINHNVQERRRNEPNFGRKDPFEISKIEEIRLDVAQRMVAESETAWYRDVSRRHLLGDEDEHEGDEASKEERYYEKDTSYQDSGGEDIAKAGGPNENQGRGDETVQGSQKEDISRRRSDMDHLVESIFGPMIPGASASALELLLYQKLVPDSQLYKTGCNKLDDMIAMPNEWLNIGDALDIGRETGEKPSTSNQSTKSGLSSGCVTEFSGPSSSGKTQLALQIAARAVLKAFMTGGEKDSLEPQAKVSPNKVMYIASGAGHTKEAIVQRFHELVSAQITSDLNGRGQPTPEAINAATKHITDSMENLLIDTADDGPQLLSLLAGLEQTLENDRKEIAQRSPDSRMQKWLSSEDLVHDRYTPCVSVLIIDSVSGILRSSSYRYSLRIGRLIKRLARDYSLAIIVTNGGSKGRGTVGPSGSSKKRVRDSDANDVYSGQSTVMDVEEGSTFYHKNTSPSRRRATTDPTGNSTSSGWRAALGQGWQRSAIDIHVVLDPILLPVPSAVTAAESSLLCHPSQRHKISVEITVPTIRAILQSHPSRVCETDCTKPKAQYVDLMITSSGVMQLDKRDGL